VEEVQDASKSLISLHRLHIITNMTTIHLSHAEKAKMAHELRRTIRELKDRGLIVAAKWSVDLLMAF